MSDAGLHDLLNQIDEKHADAHTRIRNDLERTAAMLASLTTRVESNYNYFVLQQGSLQRSIDEAKTLAQRQVDGTAVVWTTKVIVTVVTTAVAATLTIAGSAWALRGEVQDLRREQALFQKTLDRMEQQRLDDKREAQQKLSDFLNQRLENAITGLGTTPGGALPSRVKGTKK